jgi:uncharacterized protein
MLYLFRKRWYFFKKGVVSAALTSFLLLGIGTGVAIWQGETREQIRLQTSTNEYILHVDFVKTPEDQAKGLMGIDHLYDDEGMLFSYRSPRHLAFWMKNMLIPIDMLFIGSDFKVKHIEREVPPCPEEANKCPIYFPPERVQYVLEVVSGYSEKYDVKIGDRLLMNL